MEIDKKMLGQRIKKIRVAKRMTMEKFANAIHERVPEIKSGKSSVSKWERGDNVPNDIALQAIADLGGITVEELLNGNEEKQQVNSDEFVPVYDKALLLFQLEQRLLDIQKLLDAFNSPKHHEAMKEFGIATTTMLMARTQAKIKLVKQNHYKFYVLVGTFYLATDSVEDLKITDVGFDLRPYHYIVVTDKNGDEIAQFKFNKMTPTDYLDTVKKYYKPGNKITLGSNAPDDPDIPSMLLEDDTYEGGTYNDQNFS